MKHPWRSRNLDQSYLELSYPREVLNLFQIYNPTEPPTGLIEPYIIRMSQMVLLFLCFTSMGLLIWADMVYYSLSYHRSNFKKKNGANAASTSPSNTLLAKTFLLLLSLLLLLLLWQSSCRVSTQNIRQMEGILLTCLFFF